MVHNVPIWFVNLRKSSQYVSFNIAFKLFINGSVLCCGSFLNVVLRGTSWLGQLGRLGDTPSALVWTLCRSLCRNLCRSLCLTLWDGHSRMMQNVCGIFVACYICYMYKIYQSLTRSHAVTCCNLLWSGCPMLSDVVRCCPVRPLPPAPFPFGGSVGGSGGWRRTNITRLKRGPVGTKTIWNRISTGWISRRVHEDWTPQSWYLMVPVWSVWIKLKWIRENEKNVKPSLAPPCSWRQAETSQVWAGLTR